MLSHVALSQLGSFIKSLSLAEKEYYLKMQRLYAGQSLHVRLFTYLNEQPQAAAPAIMEVLGVRSPSQFTNIKNQLLQSLLDALVYRTRQTNLQTSLQQQWLHTEQLLEKRQMGLATRQNKKALLQALHLHSYPLAIQLIEQQQRILHLSRDGQYTDELEELARQWRHTVACLQLLGEIKQIYSQLIALARESPIRYSEAQLQAVQAWDQNLSQLKETGLSNEYIRMFWLAATIKSAFLQRQYGQAAQLGADFQQVLAAQPYFAVISPFIFLETANTLFYNLFAQGKTEAVMHDLALLDAFAAQHLNKEWLHKWEAIVLHTRLKIAHKQANYDQVAAILAPYEALTLRQQHMFSLSEQLNFLCSLAISHFVLEAYDAADAQMHEVKHLNATAGREDILYFSSLFHLLVLFEKKDWYQLDINVQITYQALYARRKLRPFEKELVLFIKKLSSLRQQAQMEAAARTFLEKLSAFSNPEAQQLYFPYFNYPAWLASKAAGCSYRQHCEQTYHGQQAANSAA